MPAVSIIIPCYNSEKYIAECLDTVLAQTFTDFEVITINDGSTDATATILNKYAGKDKRIHIVTQKNKGLSSARNAGLDMVTGRYVCFVDADDCINPSYLQTMFDTITGENADFVHIEHQDFTTFSEIPFKSRICEQQPSITSNPLQDLFPYKKDIFFAVWSFMYKRSVIANMRFVKDMVMCEDIVFNASFLSKANKGILLNLPLYYYRYNPNSLVHANTLPHKALSYLKSAEILYNQFKDRPDFLKQIQSTRINQELKNALKQMNKLKDKNQIVKKIKELYKSKVISFKGLSLSKKITLLRIILFHA